MEDPPKRMRKMPSRYLEHADDFEEDLAPKKSVKAASVKKSRRKSSVGASDFDVTLNDEDVIMDDGEDEVAPASTSQAKAPKLKVKAQGDGPPARKKTRKMVVSDSEEEDYMEEDAVPEPEEEEEEEDYSPDEEKPKVSKAKGKAAARGKKRKAKADPIESSRSAMERKASVDTMSTAKKKSKPSLKLEDIFVDVVDDEAPSPDVSATAENFSPMAPKNDSPAPPPKKPKLPTIKKNKLPGSTGVSTPSSSSTPLPKVKLPLDLELGSKSDARKKQLAGTDLDLSNQSIYQELFKSASAGGAPRTGLNRRSKEEERRKELNKLKEDYIAKRAEEAAHSFDLQAQHEKIARFEDKLRSMRSAALYPNWLAGKWKENLEREREREKRRQKEQEWSDPTYANGREEGEVK